MVGVAAKNMIVSVVGMGYVGIPVALILAEAGMDVIGIDIDQDKVGKLNRGEYPIEGKEPGIRSLLSLCNSTGKFRATSDYSEAKNTDVWIVCVQTPFNVGKFKPDLRALEGAISSIAMNLKEKALIVIESTVPPGTISESVIPIVEDLTGFKAGLDFSIGHCPERVMPGKLLHNLRTYGRALGGYDDESHEKMLQVYPLITKGKLEVVDILTAEVVKTFENTYRDVEIAIANDFAKYCDHLGVDFFTIRNIVNTVEARNLHFPGGGVGGHCIPKDTWLLAYGTRGKYTPELLLKAREVNDSMPEYVSERVFAYLDEIPKQTYPMKVGILGLSYLAESDDTRNSPTIDLVKILRSKGLHTSVHDHVVKGAKDVEYSSDLKEVISGSDVLVVMVAHSLYSNITPDQISSLMRGNLLIDTRNVMKVSDYQHSNINLYSLGRGHWT